MPHDAPRILFVDDNVRDIGGHYLELASLLAVGASDLGYQPVLVTHACLPDRNPELANDSRLRGIQVDPRFRVRRMENWSLGVDGPSMVRRDADGNPIGGHRLQRWTQRVRDFACRPTRRPQAMLKSWSSAFIDAVEQFNPAANDSIVINTGGDFQLLALADALAGLGRRGWNRPLKLHVVFHFAVFDGVATGRAIEFGEQVNAALHRMRPHRVRLHATTESLNQQLAAVGIAATAIPYPTRVSDRSCPSHPSQEMTRPIKLVLAGMPRAEKGRDQIRTLLQSIEQPHLRSGSFCWSMQLPKKRWRRMIPTTLLDACDQSRTQGPEPFLEILRGNLTSESYHRWLDTASVGVFLYEPDRYVARCSGVLLEMMIRGVPVIVPDHCWLADQVRDAGESTPIGWIYRSIEEIPALLDCVPGQLRQTTANCHRHARKIAACHSGRHTLLEMGISDFNPNLNCEAA